MENKAPTAADKEAAKQLAEEEQALNLMMQRLKLLHIKERMLRDTIPTMLEPLVQKHPSPDVMYAAFMKAVNEAQAKITDFTNLMRDETSTEAFARAKKSREERPLGITPWRHGDYPGWFDLDKPWTA
ncbi:hypothetical protein TsFJ059_009271 [Trichoderma semiorbis]|uniref:Uncharacterized protein n=1 Tax=Trichoderma semiorbis TaxID=1491008 RepID=A0A9P8KMD4_9HYPO|nr:hypothetical protein TsFJ059_009271 [Trichoderma semiorbis]